GLDVPRHLVDILDEVQDRAVIEEAAPLRIEPNQLQIVLELAVGLTEDAIEHAGNGKDGRPHVEAEPAAFQHGRLAAGPFVLVKDRHLVTTCRERAGGSKAPETAADDRDALWTFPLHPTFSNSNSTGALA